MAEAGQAKASSLDSMQVSHMARTQGLWSSSPASSGTREGAGLQVEQQRLKLGPIWDASV